MDRSAVTVHGNTVSLYSNPQARTVTELACKSRADARTAAAHISDASEVVLERTGHMFRFTHPHAYAAAVESFIANRVDVPSAC